MPDDVVKYGKSGAIATITLNRPESSMRSAQTCPAPWMTRCGQPIVTTMSE